MKLESLGAPGTAIPGTKLRNDTYSSAISTLKPLVGEGTPEQKAAAWLLIARSELGLAADPAAAAADAHREMATSIQGIRAELGVYRNITAFVAAAESFDPSDEIADLQAKISQRVAAASEVSAEMDTVRQQIDGLESQAAEARAASDEHRRAEASLRTEMMSLSAQAALPIATQAAEQRSRADDLAAQSDRLVAQADVLRPQITAFEGEINRLAEQQKLLEESIESLGAQREATAAEADNYRTRAAEIASRISSGIGSANAYATGPMRQVYDEAIAAFETAAGSAGKASASRSGSNLLKAEVMHMLGGTTLAHAASLDAFAATIGEAINDAGISNATLTGTLAAVRADADAARQRGQQALREARDSYQAAGVSGDGADRIDDVVASINAMLGEPDEPQTPDEFGGEMTDESGDNTEAEEPR